MSNYKIKRVNISPIIDMTNPLKSGESDGVTKVNVMLLINVDFDTPEFRNSSISFYYKDQPVIVKVIDKDNFVTSVTESFSKIEVKDIKKEIDGRIKKYVNSEINSLLYEKYNKEFNSKFNKDFTDVNNYNE